MINRQVRLTWLIAVLVLSSFSAFSDCPGTSVFVDAVDLKCNGDNSGRIVLSRTFISAETPYQYSINGGTFRSDSVFTNLSAGNYSIRVRNSLGCDSLLPLVQISEPDILVLTTGSLPADCGDDGTVFASATGGTPQYIFEWNTVPVTVTNELRNLPPGDYTVKVTDQNNCSLTQTQTVIGQIPFSISAEPATATVNFGEDLPLSVTSNRSGNQISYQWVPSNGLSCSSCASPVLTPLSNSSYVVIATDVASGCVATDTVIITVNGVVNLFVPNAFSPNGDGNNDTYKIYGLGIVSADWKIYDERGFAVFESKNPLDEWDGTIQGTKAESGLYFYRVNVIFIDGASQQKNGQLVLIR